MRLWPLRISMAFRWWKMPPRGWAHASTDRYWVRSVSMVYCRSMATR
ncbi:hypothetical protein EVA_10094 [gut metagenome]|uniref:Uncharacterized protein n=1 Tax=gut metagenome TaxID=749906 RepID=J9GPA6_9ZZZZ